MYNTCTYDGDLAWSYSADDDDTDVFLISSDKYYIYIKDDEIVMINAYTFLYMPNT